MTDAPYRRHVAVVAGRWAASRYDDAVGRAAPDLAALSGVAADLAGVPDDAPPVVVVDVRGAGTDRVRHHPAVALRLARGAEDHEQAAVVLSAVLGADLDVVRRVLGPSIAHVDGASRLVAVRGHQVVGTAILALTEEDGHLVAGLHALAVAPRWRGRGTGLALAARAVELAAGAGAPLVHAEAVPGADRILPHLGATPAS